MSYYERRLAEFRKRRQRALKLREAGKTYNQIAAALKVSRQRAFAMVQQAKRETPG